MNSRPETRTNYSLKCVTFRTASCGEAARAVGQRLVVKAREGRSKDHDGLARYDDLARTWDAIR